MLFSQVVGQQQVKQHLLDMVQQNRLSHALLFLGTEGSGALPMALAFAQYVSLLPSSVKQPAETSLFGDAASSVPLEFPKTAEDADAFIKTCRNTHELEIAGLMCIPPFEEAPAPHFALTAKIAARNGLKLLSMGMSADFATAVAFGATHVRVGTAIFGARPAHRA